MRPSDFPSGSHYQVFTSVVSDTLGESEIDREDGNGRPQVAGAYTRQIPIVISSVSLALRSYRRHHILKLDCGSL